MLKIKIRFTLYGFFENEVHFYPSILVNTKTIIFTTNHIHFGG